MHHVKIDGDNVEKIDLCEKCAEPVVGQEKAIDLSELLGLLQAGALTPGTMAKEILGDRARHSADAYDLVFEALEKCESEMISGAELLRAIRQLAFDKFGRQTRAALAGWNIFRTEDLGNIVFELLETKIFQERCHFQRDQFKNGFDFNETFPEK